MYHNKAKYTAQVDVEQNLNLNWIRLFRNFQLFSLAFCVVAPFSLSLSLSLTHTHTHTHTHTLTQSSHFLKILIRLKKLSVWYPTFYFLSIPLSPKLKKKTFFSLLLLLCSFWQLPTLLFVISSTWHITLSSLIKRLRTHKAR